MVFSSWNIRETHGRPMMNDDQVSDGFTFTFVEEDVKVGKF